jgi:hypothetical protein
MKRAAGLVILLCAAGCASAPHSTSLNCYRVTVDNRAPVVVRGYRTRAWGYYGPPACVQVGRSWRDWQDADIFCGSDVTVVTETCAAQP